MKEAQKQSRKYVPEPYNSVYRLRVEPIRILYIRSLTHRFSRLFFRPGDQSRSASFALSKDRSFLVPVFLSVANSYKYSVQVDIDPPQIAVIGSPSAEKSSFVEVSPSRCWDLYSVRVFFRSFPDFYHLPVNYLP